MRHRGKIEAVIHNAKCVQTLIREAAETTAQESTNAECDSERAKEHELSNDKSTVGATADDVIEWPCGR